MSEILPNLMASSSVFTPVVPAETIEVIVVKIPPPARQDERVEEVKDQPRGERRPRLGRRLSRVPDVLLQVLEF